MRRRVTTVTELSALPTVRQQNEGFRPSGHPSTKWAPPYESKTASTYGTRCTNRHMQNKNYKNSSFHIHIQNKIRTQ